MRKLSLGTLFVAALAVCGPVHAGWVYFASGKAVTAYFDPLAISNGEAGTVKLWSLSDLSQPRRSDFDDRYYLSSATQAEFDCATDRARLLAFRWYAGNMGRGEVIHADSDPANWDTVEPDTLFAAMFGIACGK